MNHVATALLRATLTAAALAASAVLALAWFEGRRVWPEAEGTAPTPITSPAADVAARLRTRPPGAPLRIALVGDVQNGTPELRTLLDEVVRQRPDVVVILGDTVNRPLPGRYAALRDVVTQHGGGLPVLAVPGNHDLQPDGTLDDYREWVGPASWRFDADGWAFLGLDDASGRFAPESLALVRELAAAPPSRGWIAIVHRPLASRTRADGEAARAAELRDAAPSAPALVASGHVHRDEDFVDARGTRHLLFSANCDRDDHGPSSPTIDFALLTLGDGAPVIERVQVPRVCSILDELRRVAAADVYPAVRPAAWVLPVGAAALAGLAVLLASGRPPLVARRTA